MFPRGTRLFASGLRVSIVVGFDVAGWDADIIYRYVRIQKMSEHECGAA
jgi:hypothetical protein